MEATPAAHDGEGVGNGEGIGTSDVIPAANALELGAAEAEAAETGPGKISKITEQKPQNGTPTPQSSNPCSSTNVELDKASGT